MIHEDGSISTKRIILTDPDVVLEVGKTVVSVKDSKDNVKRYTVERLFLPLVTDAFIGVCYALGGVPVFYRLEDILSVHHLKR